MKKTAMFGLLAMVLAFGFIGMGCPTEDSGYNGNFRGKWEGAGVVLEFTADNNVGVILGSADPFPGGTFTTSKADTVATIAYAEAFASSASQFGRVATLNKAKDAFTTETGVTFTKKK